MNTTFPEDIERLITESSLQGDKNMCSTMTLVASRFYTWTKPIRYRAVMINTQRLHDLDILMSHAEHIQILALDLHEVKFFYDKPEDHWKAKEVPPPELAKIDLLLKRCSRTVRHLAVSWDVWANLPQACGSLQLESLYLIWDGRYHIPDPSLECLQYPDILKDLVVSAPPDLRDINYFRSWGELYLDTDYLRSRDGSPSKVSNLVQLTYASLNPPMMLGNICGYVPSLESLVFVQLELVDEDEEGIDNKQPVGCPILHSLKLRSADQLLREWVAKCEGRNSMWDVLERGEGECGKECSERYLDAMTDEY